MSGIDIADNLTLTLEQIRDVHLGIRCRHLIVDKAMIHKTDVQDLIDYDVTDVNIHYTKFIFCFMKDASTRVQIHQAADRVQHIVYMFIHNASDKNKYVIPPGQCVSYATGVKFLHHGDASHVVRGMMHNAASSIYVSTYTYDDDGYMHIVLKNSSSELRSLNSSLPIAAYCVPCQCKLPMTVVYHHDLVESHIRKMKEILTVHLTSRCYTYDEDTDSESDSSTDSDEYDTAHTQCHDEQSTDIDTKHDDDTISTTYTAHQDENDENYNHHVVGTTKIVYQDTSDWDTF